MSVKRNEFLFDIYEVVEVNRSKRSPFALNDCCLGDESILQKHIERLFDIKEDISANKNLHYGLKLLNLLLPIVDIIRLPITLNVVQKIVHLVAISSTIWLIVVISNQQRFQRLYVSF